VAEGRAWPGGRGAWAALAALFLAGVLHWLVFFGVFEGGMSFAVADWPKEFRYYSAVRQALLEGRVPYYVSRPIHQTRKLLALPELSWSPQVALLRVVDVPAFLAVNTVLLYAAGFAACLALGRRYRLSTAPFLLLVLVALFNGHVTAHLAVGHSMWAGALLLPAFALLVLALLEDPGRRTTPVWIGLLLFAILLQGSFHVFVWCLLFLGLLLAFHSAGRRAVLAAMFWSLALGACRLVPPAVVLLGRREQPFLSGYPTPLTLLEAMSLIRTVSEPVRGGRFDTLDWWEYDAYVGVAAVCWLAWFGVWRRAAAARRAASGGVATRGRWAVDGPLAGMTALALGDLYYPINATGIPLLASQRVSSRFVLVPLVLLAVLAAVRAETDLAETAGRRLRPLLLLGALVTALSLAAHSWTWRLPAIEAAWPPAPHRRDLAIEVGPLPASETERDRAYVASVQVSLAASLLALGAAGRRLWTARNVPA
jgi:hypothetical protein